MSNPAQSSRFLVPVLVVSVAVALGCSGLMGDGAKTPDAGTDKPVKVDTSKLKVGSSEIKRGAGRPDKMPTGATLERSRKKDEYVVKLAPGVRDLEFRDGQPVTGNAKLDGAFGQLGLQEAGRVHRNEARNKAVADRLGVGRTVRIRTAKSPEEVMAKLEAHPDVEWVEPVTEMRNHSITPNDPYFMYQWHMQNLNVGQAWQTTQGEGVVVAVVDTGVSANEDGFFKLLKGMDFVENDNDPADMNGHGSHVAGTIGQASNNGIGTAGVAPKVSILPVRVLDANGSGSNTWVAEGIIWAVDNGANIINLSLGSSSNSEAVADACAYAYENNVTVVAATGNDGFTDFIGFPAALPTTIAVGSVDLKNNVAFYSNQGKQIDLVGPGGDTTADLNNDGMQDGVVQETRMTGVWSYYFLQGTSMATPHVAGVAALVYANGVHDPEAIRDVLNQSATDLGDKGWDTTYGNGLVNPVAALGMKAPRGGGRDSKLTIARARAKTTGDTRAVIGWLTNEPAMTMVKGDNGFERKDDTLSKVHQVAVQGRAGTTVVFTIGSQTSKENRVKDTVTVQF